jgi:hypothetical protein
MQKGNNIIVYKGSLKSDKIIKECTDENHSKFKNSRNGNEIFRLNTYGQIGQLASHSIKIKRHLNEH